MHTCILTRMHCAGPIPEGSHIELLRKAYQAAKGEYDGRCKKVRLPLLAYASTYMCTCMYVYTQHTYNMLINTHIKTCVIYPLCDVVLLQETKTGF